MLYSMTGFGRAEGKLHDKKFSVEVKSLNGKSSDVRLKIPAYFREKELVIRQMISKKLIRGKIDAIISIVSESGDDEYGLNKDLFRKYYNELNGLKSELSIADADIMSSILRIPNVIQTQENDLNDEDWKLVSELIESAVSNLQNFRKTEGDSLEKDLRHRVDSIASLLTQIEPFEKERMVVIKDRIRKNINEFFNNNANSDENRFEQEIFYYLEKLDINEEKIRLAQHCKYFVEQLEQEGISKGRKLNFISQEIGREINTIGSKAQFSAIQQIVVQMKDDLEKIKEQLLNTL